MYKNEVTLTKDGLARLQENYERLKTRYRDVSRELRLRIRDGDGQDPVVQIKSLEQEFLQGDIQKMEKLLLTAKTVEAVANPEFVQAGMRVQYEESGKTFSVTLVDPLEADPPNGYISVRSPIGSALLGHKPSETVTAITPVGTKLLTIITIM